MKKQNISISLIFMLVLIGGLVYITFGVKSEKPYNISVIEIDGNLHLPKNAYFEYANLQDKNGYRLLTLKLIRDRIAKHPYVKFARVEYDGSGKVQVDIKEKEFKALLLDEGKQYIITRELEVLPVLPGSQRMDYPVIRNIAGAEKPEMLGYAVNNKSIIKSFKILTAAKLLNPGLYDNLSEIDLRNGNNVVIYFSSVNYPVILGSKNEVTKMVIFEKLWENIGKSSANDLLDYVDLRFDDKVYLGVSGKIIEAKGIQS